MTGYLDHIFAGERVRRTEDRHEHLIQDLAVAVQGGVVDGIYIRYMDDMMILCPSKAQAWDIITAVDDYLKEYLGLQLNNKTAIMPVGHRIEFVGRVVTPDRIELRKSTTLQMKRHLAYIMEHYAAGELPLEYCQQVIVSYLGLMKHCSCDELRQKVLDDFVLIRRSE